MSCIDFLVWQGHSRRDVMNMTLRQLNLFVQQATDRLRELHAPEQH